jgi:hypothetical protein
MKVSNSLWIKAIGFNLLALTGLVLFLYALTGDFWRTVLASLLVFLVSHLSRKGSAYAAMAMQHRVIEIMEDEKK